MGNILEEIILNDFLRIGEGNSRICYDHPSDNTKVLKISKHNLIKVCDNELEYKYFTYLRKRIFLFYIYQIIMVLLKQI